ncbi:PREDICTED: P2Y purinoceptor 3-like [Cyprinodon variegatus]|uniref:P2Y purinoceptor 3-like n=1 Tax=Cyprinodon variegatus TaxID=28743 RepID=UPI000742891C|nr:PREDICTED: P2Y purinoceptor 3-like [Cyprinodon variegatus]
MNFFMNIASSPPMSSNSEEFPIISTTMPQDVVSSSSPAPSSPPASSCSINESYKYIFLPICYSFTFLFSITLNSVILYRSFRQTKRWNASLIYMVNLASTDFMYGLSLPFLVASYIMHDRWVFGDFMCRLVRFLFYFNLYCSIFFLTCISVHRYLGICHPMKVITLETKKAVKNTCILVWIVVFALTCPIFRFAQTGHITKMAGTWTSATTTIYNGSHDASSVKGNNSYNDLESLIVGYQNCWDDAIDKEFLHYVPYGIILHLLGFFVPFSIIAWCYSQVVLTIFKTLKSRPSSRKGPRNGDCNVAERRGRSGSSLVGRESNGVLGAIGKDDEITVFLGAHSPYASRRRKSIRTIITITLLFALCFFPFHVTRTIFLLLKVAKRVPCQTMTTVSMCYKITRPLASFNAWLNALLYFLTKDKVGAHCCPVAKSSSQQQSRLILPLRTMGRAESPIKETIGDQIINERK